MTYVLYGIKNCDTVRKARTWLDERAVDYRFHDFREDGLSEAVVGQWLHTAGWEQVINKRSTTWKGLDAATRDTMDAGQALRSAIEAPTLIKRPVLTGDGILEFGFKADRYNELLS